MQIVYHGPHTDGVSVPAGAGEVFLAHGVATELPDPVAKALLAEQPESFTAAKKAAKAEEAE